MLANFVLGLLVIGVGVCTIYFSGVLTQMFGRIAWADKNVGGTKQLFVLIGFAICIIGAMFMFGFVNVAQVQNAAIDADLGGNRLGE